MRTLYSVLFVIFLITFLSIESFSSEKSSPVALKETAGVEEAELERDNSRSTYQEEIFDLGSLRVTARDRSSVSSGLEKKSAITVERSFGITGGRVSPAIKVNMSDEVPPVTIQDEYDTALELGVGTNSFFEGSIRKDIFSEKTSTRIEGGITSGDGYLENSAFSEAGLSLHSINNPDNFTRTELSFVLDRNSREYPGRKGFETFFADADSKKSRFSFYMDRDRGEGNFLSLKLKGARESLEETSLLAASRTRNEIALKVDCDFPEITPVGEISVGAEIEKETLAREVYPDIDANFFRLKATLEQKLLDVANLALSTGLVTRSNENSRIEFEASVTRRAESGGEFELEAGHRIEPRSFEEFTDGGKIISMTNLAGKDSLGKGRIDENYTFVKATGRLKPDENTDVSLYCGRRKVDGYAYCADRNVRDSSWTLEVMPDDTLLAELGAEISRRIMAGRTGLIYRKLSAEEGAPKIPYNPDFTLDLWFEKDFPYELKTRLDMVTQGKRPVDSVASSTLGSCTTFDFYVSKKVRKDFEIKLDVLNLFNTDFEERRNLPGQEREIRLKTVLRF